MDIRNCPMCGNMFQYVGSRVCPNCEKKLEDKLQEVKKYLEENNGASVSKTSEDCDVPVKQLRRWVREERLMFAPGVDTGLVCSQCGRPIASGTMCKECKEKMVKGFSDAGTPSRTPERRTITPDTKSRMHLTKLL